MQDFLVEKNNILFLTLIVQLCIFTRDGGVTQITYSIVQLCIFTIIYFLYYL